MGVTFHEFKFLEYITKSQTLGNVLTLGRQELILNENDLKKLNVIKNKNFVEKWDKLLTGVYEKHGSWDKRKGYESWRLEAVK